PDARDAPRAFAPLDLELDRPHVLVVEAEGPLLLQPKIDRQRQHDESHDERAADLDDDETVRAPPVPDQSQHVPKHGPALGGPRPARASPSSSRDTRPTARRRAR